MSRIKKSEYVRISRDILKKLSDETCYGKGSLYLEILKKGTSPEDIGKVEDVLEALVRQNIVCKKKKEHGWKYYLNIERLDKIKKIIKEKGRKSIIHVLLML